MAQELDTENCCDCCGRPIKVEEESYDVHMSKTRYRDPEGIDMKTMIEPDELYRGEISTDYIVIGPCCADIVIPAWNEFVSVVNRLK